MPRPPLVQVWSKGSSTSASSTSTYSHDSSDSSLSQYTNNTSYSAPNAMVKHYETFDECEIVDEVESDRDGQEIDPRASTDTYASTVASESESSKLSSFFPMLRQVCYHSDAIATTPAEFGELFPSTRRILIQHDDTTPDGNLNLRLDTELSISKGHKVKLTLFHLRMYDLADRQFSLRRYHRQSSREVCNSRRKFLKPVAKPSSPPTRRSLSSTLAKMNLMPWKGKTRPKSVQEMEEELVQEESDDDLQFFAAQADVKATIPTNTVRLEFSNYAQVELERGRRGDGRMFDFEYWGERYHWRRNVYKDGSDAVFSFELVNLASGVCVAHITPDKLSDRHKWQEAAQGSWVPPCSMRITEKQMSSDLGDVVVATGLITLVEDCINRHWREPHRP